MTMPQRGNSGDVWLTPKHIIDALGKFDLDPCAAPLPRPWETASASFVEADDGLSQEWFGRVWMNPPYGRGIGAWMKKMAEHAKAGGGGISLVFARTDTKAWQDYVLPYTKRILFLQGRLRFHTPDGLPGKDVANAPSALIAYTIDDALALSESGIPGWIVEPVKQLKG